MKKIISLVMATGLCISLFASDLFDYAPIQGKVKSYTETEFSIASKFGNYFRTPSAKITHQFDSKGLKISSTEYTPRDAIVDKITSKYDSDGNNTELVCSSAEGEIIWKQVSTFKDGVRIDTSEYDSKGTLKDKTIFTYEGGKLVDATIYNGEGVLDWKTTYKYNVDGKIDTVSEYSSDGKLNEQNIYTYTDSGSINSILNYVTFTEKQSEKVFRYNSNGTLNEITTYNSAKQVIKRILLKYDSNDNLVKVSEYDVAEKFGTTVNELVAMSEFVYEY